MSRYRKVAVAEYAEVLMGQSPPSSTCSEAGEGMPFIQGNAEFGARYPSPRLKCSSPTRVAEAGDLLLSIRAPVGELNQAVVQTVIGRGLSALRFHLEDQRYAWHAVRWSAGTLNRVAQGSTFVAVSRHDVEKLEIPWYAEANERIAAVLDTIDEAIASTEAVIAKLKKIRSGMLHDILTRGLDEHGQLRDPILHPEQFKNSPLGLIPKEWECDPIERHTISSAYGPRFPGECYSEQGNVALMRTTDMDNEGNLSLEQMPLAKLPLHEFRTHFLEVGDFLISRSGTCGIGSVFHGYRYPVLPGAFLIRFRLAPSLLPEFLRLYVNSDRGARRIRDLAEGGVQKNIRGSALLRHHIAVPSPGEQHAMLYAANLLREELDREQTELLKLYKVKSGLMNDLLTDKVRVPAEVVSL